MKGLFAKRGLLPEYLSHLLRAISPVLFATVEESGHGTRCLRLDLWRNILVGLPSDEEQRSIVRYIDRKTAQIDALIARKQRQIELLGEKRQALISQAVTKGLDPSAPMRPSGIPWLGEVPEHWEVTRIKWVARMESGHTPDKKVEAYWTNCNIPWVSLNDSKQLRVTDYISETAHYVNELGIANSSARLLPPGAVVFSRDATIGLCAITTREMAVSQHFIAWLCGPRVRPEYLLRVFQCMTEELDRLTFGATVKTIGMPDVRELVMPLPPIGEQDAIVQAVRGYRTSGNDLGRKVQRQVDLLREYRQTLISAAVTGKVQVPTELAK
jgi:type I restriction enzyme S subunit